MQDSQRPILTAHHISKRFFSENENLAILHNITLEINSGESVAIMGASGSGKTTLLTILAGLDVPTEGEVILAGHQLFKLSEEERTRLRATTLSFIFQSFYLLPALTALENVMLPLELQGLSSSKAHHQAKEWLTKVQLAHRLQHYPHQLSGGEQQRTAIARAFVTQPRVIFADEMTGNLDELTAVHISDLIFQLNQQQGTTLIMATHDRQLSTRCHRVLQLQHGVLRPC